MLNSFSFPRFLFFPPNNTTTTTIAVSRSLEDLAEAPEDELAEAAEDSDEDVFEERVRTEPLARSSAGQAGVIEEQDPTPSPAPTEEPSKLGQVRCFIHCVITRSFITIVLCNVEQEADENLQSQQALNAEIKNLKARLATASDAVHRAQTLELQLKDKDAKARRWSREGVGGGGGGGGEGKEKKKKKKKKKKK